MAMRISDILQAHGYGGGGFKVGSDIPFGTYKMVDVKKDVWKKATTYGTNNVISIRYRKSANELYCLTRSDRKVHVIDLWTGTIKRTLQLPANGDTAFGINTLYDLLISEGGRLYIFGRDPSGYYNIVTEVNATTGAPIKKFQGTNSTSSIEPYHIQLIDDSEIYMCMWTGYIDVITLDLTLIKSLAITNSVGNRVYGVDIDKARDRVVYPQTSNNATTIKSLSDAGASLSKGITTNGSSWSCCFTKSYIAVCGPSTVVVVDPIAGTEIKRITGSWGYVSTPVHLGNDVICVMCPFANPEKLVVVDLVAGTIEFESSWTRPNTNTNYLCRGVAIDDAHVATPFAAEYGLYKLVQQIQKR